MRALILGASGAIGSAVARHCSASGIETHLGLRAGSDRARLAHCADRRRHIVCLDDPGSVAVLVRSVEPDWILMAAFPAHVRDGAADARRGTWLQMGENMLGLMGGLGLAGYSGTVTLLGSATAYASGPGRIDEVPQSPTFRGAVKAAESLLAAQLAGELGIQLTELRVFTGYGPFEQTDRLVPSLLRAALSGGSIQLSERPRRRDWIHYQDIAAACIASAEYRQSGAALFDACSGQLHDSAEVARLLERITGRNLVREGAYLRHEEYGDARAGHVPGAGSCLGWQPRIGLEEGLQQCWSWARSAEGRAYLAQPLVATA